MCDQTPRTGYSTASNPESFILIGILTFAATSGTAVLFYYIGRYTVHCGDCQAKSNTKNTTTNTSETLPRPKQNGRLPRTISAILYKVELFPDIYGDDPSQFIFNGFVSFRFNCLEQTNSITMNINKINITNGFIKVANDSNMTLPTQYLNIIKYETDAKWQFLKIMFDGMLRTGQDYIVNLNYTGPLKTDFAGLYLSTFQRRISKKYVAATQFSPTDARKAFPCLDEPDRKAQFDITLVRRKDYVSLSNMPKRDQIPREDGYIADVYQRTPIMSPYLVAMVVGDLTPKTIEARPGLNFTAWAGRETIANTETALNVGAQALTFFEEYFGIQFPLPKQDILALPETAVGAMENWGLIIFNDARIFYNSKEYSISSLKLSVKTITHEISHQWFGNLVTMNWWSDLMLKEGFAVYFEDVGIAHIYPDWNIMDEYAVENMHQVFEMDGLATSHPLYMELLDTTQIRQVFDDISYRKGGCMIRMLNFVLGDADFKRGLRYYLQQHKYDNVGHNDLWSALQSHRTHSNLSQPSIKDVMDTWILQMNYPVLTFTQISPGKLHVRQERFLSNDRRNITEQVDSPFNYIWKIPLTYTTNMFTNFDQSYSDILWMLTKELYIFDKSLPDLHEPGQWLVANIKQWGYYRVNYDVHMWENVISQLKRNHSVIDVVNRAQILNDLFSFGKANILNFSIPLASLEYLRNESDFTPWVAAIKEIGFLESLLKYTDIYSSYKKVILTLINELFLNLHGTFETLSDKQKLTYVELFSLACRYEMAECVHESLRVYRSWKNDEVNKIDPNIRDTVICTAVATGDSIDWDFVLHKYNTTINVNEKEAYLRGLACTRDDNLQNRLINLTIDADTIQGREAVMVLIYLADDKLALPKVWRHVTENWNRFMRAYAGSLFLLANLAKGITAPFVTQSQLDQVETFVSNTADLGPAENAFKQSMEKIRSNIAWLKDHLNTIEDWVTRV